MIVPFKVVSVDAGCVQFEAHRGLTFLRWDTIRTLTRHHDPSLAVLYKALNDAGVAHGGTP